MEIPERPDHQEAGESTVRIPNRRSIFFYVKNAREKRTKRSLFRSEGLRFAMQTVPWWNVCIGG